MTEKQIAITGLAATSFVVSLAFSYRFPVAVTGLTLLVGGLWITLSALMHQRAVETLNQQGQVIQGLEKLHHQRTTSDIIAYLGKWIGGLVPCQNSFIWGEMPEPQTPPWEWAGWQVLAQQALEENRILLYPGENNPFELPKQIQAMMVVPLTTGTGPGLALFMINGANGMLNNKGNRAIMEKIRIHVSAAIGNMTRENTRAAHQQTLLQIAIRVLEGQDQNLIGHSERVAYVSRLIGARLGLNGDELEVLECGALLHDIGKGAHTEGDQAIDHASLGAGFLPEQGFYAEVKEAIQSHHERYDGSGYPAGLCYTDIPLPARIIALADLYDALICLAPAPDRLDHAAAAAVLKRSIGSYLDPLVFTAFEEIAEDLNRNVGDDDKDNRPS